MTLRWDAQTFNRVRIGATRGVVIGATLIQNDIVKRIREPPKTGRIYKRRGREHQASAPGESPATDTGRLAKSVQRERPTQEGSIVRCRVQLRAKYARALEYGTPRIAPRPYVRISVVAQKKAVIAAIRNEIAAAMDSRRSNR